MKKSITERTDFAVVMMVKDEIDVIDEAIVTWRARGARVYVCDNGSTDGTLERLNTYKGVYGDELHVESDPETAYFMEKRINALKDRALSDGFRWIIPADADETWHFGTNDFSAYLADLYDGTHGPRWFSVPYVDVSPTGNRRLHTHQKGFGYLDGNCHISIGNHIITGAGSVCVAPGAIIEHFPVRSRAQMEKKLINHMSAFVAAGYEHQHTRDFYECSSDPVAFFDRKWKEFNF